MKRGFLPLIMTLFILPKLSAAMVSFLVVETGLPAGSERPQSSFIWENEMLNVFFDAGHIVSNAPIVRIENEGKEKLPPQARSELAEAREGGADYFVLVLLEYPGSAHERPRRVSIRLFNAVSGRLLFEISRGAGKEGADERNEAKQSAVKLVPELGK